MTEEIKIDEEDLAKQFKDKILHALAIDLQEKLKSRLTPEHGIGATGAATGLKGSIIARVVNDEIIISMHDYGKYLEYGTPPHFPPIEPLIPWVRLKWGASGDRDERQKAFALAKHISIHGTRPYPFIRPTLFVDLPKMFGNIIKDITKK